MHGHANALLLLLLLLLQQDLGQRQFG